MEKRHDAKYRLDAALHGLTLKDKVETKLTKDTSDKLQKIIAERMSKGVK